MRPGSGLPTARRSSTKPSPVTTRFAPTGSEARRRSLDDLGLARAILTTRWERQGGRRLHPHDLVAFQRAFGRRRLAAWPFATPDRDDLLEGASRLIGEWFPGGWSDPARRGGGSCSKPKLRKGVSARAAAREGPTRTSHRADQAGAGLAHVSSRPDSLPRAGARKRFSTPRAGPTAAPRSGGSRPCARRSWKVGRSRSRSSRGRPRGRQCSSGRT